jgi:hypothetical protein
MEENAGAASRSVPHKAANRGFIFATAGCCSRERFERGGWQTGRRIIRNQPFIVHIPGLNKSKRERSYFGRIILPDAVHGVGWLFIFY